MKGGTDSTLLAITVTKPAPHVIVVQVRGALDMPSAPELDRVMGSVLIGPVPRRLVLDLTELRFLDSHGLAALIRLHHQTATAAGPDVLRLVGLHPLAIRILALTGVLALFDVYDTVESALDDVPARACRWSPPS
jgi:anti-anti-sigma factor